MSRTVYPIDRNWLYGGVFKTGSTAEKFNDSSFAAVTIPHANVTLPWHGFDDRDYQFVSIYRRHFRLPAAHKGQRVFADFDGVMTAAEVFLNGQRVGAHKGGYTPFSCELTDALNWGKDNVLAVKVDSTERPDIPPFGDVVDYLTFGGIYREVRIRVVHEAFLENVFACPRNVLTDPALRVQCFVNFGQAADDDLELEVQLRKDGKVIAQASAPVTGPQTALHLDRLKAIRLWDIDSPELYEVAVVLKDSGQAVDEAATRVGFRQAEFTPEGFLLNGRLLKLRGLNRHQIFPYVGQAMPARVQRQDALILKNELKVNIVRTSHYPQSPHFLDCCDEIGLLVFEEIPGWQFIGDAAWKDVSCQNVEEMIRRDWNHPAIILWGVRINESADDHDFYVRTNAIAHALDDSRPTGGVKCHWDNEMLEDVWTQNDFGTPLVGPKNPRYLVTEFGGHTFPTKHIDNVERVTEHVLRHARIQNQAAGTPQWPQPSLHHQYAGAIGWCAFDYNTHATFGSGDRICYHGVSDIFRIPKAAAGLYKSQADPKDEIVLEPAFQWSCGDLSGGGGVGTAVVCSNCDELRFYLADKLMAVELPDRVRFANLPHPPFLCEKLVNVWARTWQDLRIDGYIKGKKVISRTLSSQGIDKQLLLASDDSRLVGDGIDATRVVFRVTDEFGNTKPFATGAVQLSIQGPGEIIGENPFALTGGVGAVWVKTRQAAGAIRLTATHPYLGSKSIRIAVAKAAKEKI